MFGPFGHAFGPAIFAQLLGGRGPTTRAKWAKNWFALRDSAGRDLVKTSRKRCMKQGEFGRLWGARGGIFFSGPPCSLGCCSSWASFSPQRSPCTGSSGARARSCPCRSPCTCSSGARARSHRCPCARSRRCTGSSGARARSQVPVPQSFHWVGSYIALVLAPPARTAFTSAHHTTKPIVVLSAASTA
jgi:hypothetical protein